MSAICIARFSSDRDLALLSQALRQHKVIHRITEEQHQQCLWVANPAFGEVALALIQAFDAGTLTVTPQHNVPAPSAWLSGVLHGVLSTPITWVLIVLGGLGYAVVALPIMVWYQALTYVPIFIQGENFWAAPFDVAQAWRIVTPLFLHFSWLHILFNAAAMLQIGSWLERFWGPTFYAALCLATGIAGNALQYMGFATPLFGGLSGVVFGLFAFNAVTQKLNPSKAYILPIGAYIWLAAWLVAGFTPLFSGLLGVNVGNGAHLGGAIMGAVLAVFANRGNNVKH